MKFIKRLKYAYSRENIKNSFRVWPVRTSFALIGDLCIIVLVVGVTIWGIG